MTIQDIINDFDFETVRAYMHLVKWKYKDEKETPSIEELKHTALYLLGQCEDRARLKPNETTSCSTGGFKAVYTSYDRNLRLEFIIVKDKAFMKI